MQTLLEGQANNRRRLKNFVLAAVLVFGGLFITWRVIFPSYSHLGQGKNLVGRGPDALNVSAPSQLAMEALGPNPCGKIRCSWSQMQRMAGERDLLPEQLPTLVTFSDPKNPKTARVIEPSEFPLVFGPGYRFKRAWIEMTTARVTRSIEEKLPWLSGFKGYTGGGRKDPQNPERNLAGAHFIRG